jgi:V/A-type H+-transporting ATPase subunit I
MDRTHTAALDQHAVLRPRRVRWPTAAGVAVVALADAADAPIVTVLIRGGVLIMLIEGLVVSIQTTRLVLFEFFTRFFRPEGREFRPLAAPPVTTEER